METTLRRPSVDPLAPSPLPVDLLAVYAYHRDISIHLESQRLATTLANARPPLIFSDSSGSTTTPTGSTINSLVSQDKLLTCLTSASSSSKKPSIGDGQDVTSATELDLAAMVAITGDQTHQSGLSRRRASSDQGGHFVIERSVGPPPVSPKNVQHVAASPREEDFGARTTDGCKVDKYSPESSQLRWHECRKSRPSSGSSSYEPRPDNVPSHREETNESEEELAAKMGLLPSTALPCSAASQIEFTAATPDLSRSIVTATSATASTTASASRHVASLSSQRSTWQFCSVTYKRASTRAEGILRDPLVTQEDRERKRAARANVSGEQLRATIAAWHAEVLATCGGDLKDTPHTYPAIPDHIPSPSAATAAIRKSPLEAPAQTIFFLPSSTPSSLRPLTPNKQHAAQISSVSPSSGFAALFDGEVESLVRVSEIKKLLQRNGFSTDARRTERLLIGATPLLRLGEREGTGTGRGGGKLRCNFEATEGMPTPRPSSAKGMFPACMPPST